MIIIVLIQVYNCADYDYNCADCDYNCADLGL